MLTIFNHRFFTEIFLREELNGIVSNTINKIVIMTNILFN